MNFSLATLSLALAASTMATGAQARVMRGTALGRELEIELSLSLSMPAEELAAAELDSPSDTESKKYTAAEQQQFQDRFDKTPLGAAIASWQKNATAANSGASASSAAAAADGSKTAKTSFCDRQLDTVIDLVYKLTGASIPPQIVTAACSFGGIGYEYFDDDDDDAVDDDDLFYAGVKPNRGCPVVAFPTYGGGGVAATDDMPPSDDNVPSDDGPPPPLGPSGGYFLDEKSDYLGPEGELLWSFNEYCECHQGYNLGCASKIPYPEYGPAFSEQTPPGAAGGDSQVASPYDPNIIVYPGDNHKKWQEYCKFVAIWNADVSDSFEESYALFNGLSKEVKECGCYFIASAEGMVGECPGVTLFDRFVENEPV